MAKTETKEKLEREYTIPLRRGVSKVPRYRKAKRAVDEVRKFMIRHMKIRDGDLSKIKIDRYLNEYLWFRGIKKPVSKVKVKAIKEFDKDSEIVRVELAELPEFLKFKKQRNDKSEAASMEKKDKKKKVKEEKKETEEQKETRVEEEKNTEEKKASVVEAGQEMEKAAAMKAKHNISGKMKEPKRQRRMALQK
jgi:large subunit ribosomal protein L31e